ncbi:MAG: MFS transporter [Akkermansiaceae bacterium]|nr:MFS transporter [Akkermansiaceae bacterium]
MAFRTLYHARAYYPVFAILFTDMGLTGDQFMLLNVVWALSILLLEVPSGALADTLGRKTLLIFGAATMVLEMSVLLVAPLGGMSWLFAFCLLNRFLSGLSEAAVSGADEAITYESLPAEGRTDAWDRILVSAMRWRSAGFLVAMTIGGLLYDPSWWNGLVPERLHVAKEVAHRLPVVMVLLQGVACLVLALRFEEQRIVSDMAPMDRCREATRTTLRTAHMALTTRAIALVLLGGMLIDAVARNMATLNSVYYRLIGLPEWVYGLIGSSIAVCNWFVPGIAARINRHFSTQGSLVLGGGVALLALLLLLPTMVVPGLAAVMLLMMLMGYVNFTVGRYLHQESGSDQRATLLSVKGMSFNLSYGIYALIFAGMLKQAAGADEPERLHQVIFWQAGGFVGVLGLYLLLLWLKRQKPDAANE